ncbi:methyltransferase, FxLD system [Actinocorallia sp. B10E7]|uniref:methyltransferase, FxLD system n=1 Tax=Actinocorallia sp. B10E7 TaxID=3153558 RepID=UPI00325EED9F
MTADTHRTASAARLRAAMVDTLRKQGWIRRPEVAAAFLAVPREVFGPEAPTLEAAYSADDVIRTRFNDRGRAISSVSAPWLQADMIEAARVREGMRVLEVGSGGYNAALLDEIVGETGHVVTVDIDPWVTERAGRFLAQSGHAGVTVVTGDAEHAADPYGPFDAILVTVGAWDCPWGRLLAQGARMVVPLVFSTITRSITFVRDGDRLVGENPTVCGFVPMQGAGAHPEAEALLADGAVRLTIEDDPGLDVAELDKALTAARTESWTGITVAGNEPFDTLNLWIATADTALGQIWKDPARTCDLAEPATRWHCPALIERDGFAYLALREVPPVGDGRIRFEFGVYGHGPHRTELTRRLHDHIQTWNHDRRRRPGPAFTLYPADARVPTPAVGRIFLKRHTALLMRWA